AFLTEAQVKQVLGYAVAFHKAQPPTGCSWTTVDLSAYTSNTASLNLTVTAESKARLTKLKRSEKGNGLNVHGLGDWAFFDERFPSGALYVWSKDPRISVNAQQVASPLAADKLAAKLVLARL